MFLNWCLRQGFINEAVKIPGKPSYPKGDIEILIYVVCWTIYFPWKLPDANGGYRCFDKSVGKHFSAWSLRFSRQEDN